MVNILAFLKISFTWSVLPRINLTCLTMLPLALLVLIPQKSNTYDFSAQFQQIPKLINSLFHTACRLSDSNFFTTASIFLDNHFSLECRQRWVPLSQHPDPRLPFQLTDFADQSHSFDSIISDQQIPQFEQGNSVIIQNTTICSSHSQSLSLVILKIQ